MSSRRSRKNDPDMFCYVCGKFTLRQHPKSISEFVVKAYFAYFGIKLGDQDKRWAPHITCSVCYSNLHGWTCRKRSLPFGIPMIWREAANHTNDCYFCLKNTQGFTAKNKSKIKYPITNSAILPVPHSDDLPIPVFSSLPQDEVLSQACHFVNKICETINRDLSETESQTTESEEDDDNQDLDFSLPSCSNETVNKTPDTFNQGELNDIIKIVNFLLGQQSGYTMFPCFICLWDSRPRDKHWGQKDWPKRIELNVGDKSIINKPVVQREKIVFPPLHIKLGLMNQFVKALDKEGSCFQYLFTSFPNLSIEKLKAGVFDGPQIRKLVNDPCFVNSMNSLEKNAWISFVDVIKNFLGNVKAINYVEIVEKMLKSFENFRCNMSIKVHFLFSHLSSFPENLGSVSDEQGERFHQDIKIMEERYQGHWDVNMMADYCWNLKRDNPSQKHSQLSQKRHFVPH